MERKIVLGVLALSLLLLGVTLLIPGGRAPDAEPLLPWKITRTPEGRLHVFGLTLGASTLADARKTFREQGEVNLFRSPEGDTTLEAYFERVSISGIKADIVLSLSVEPPLAQEMYERGARISQLGSGSKKVSLATRDLDRAASLPIGHVTYLPSADLDAELISRRFGEPQQKIPDPRSAVVHWLYPDRGLDIGLNPDGREVFQYFPRSELDRVLEPLRRSESAPPASSAHRADSD